MRRLRACFVRLLGIFSGARRDREFADELEAHLQLHIADNLRGGMTHAEARRRAILALGGVEQTRERWRDQRRFPLIDQLLQDLRYGVRLLRKYPVFTTTAVVTLALGIGMTTAAFAVLRGVLLRPLPVTGEKDLVALFATAPRHGLWREPISGPRFREWQDRAEVFEDVAVATRHPIDLALAGPAERLDGELVSTNFFDVLGVRAVAGRTFTAAGGQVGATDVPCMISERLWRTHFAGDPAVLGITISSLGTPLTIVGVVPDSFARWRSSVVSTVRGISIWLPYESAPGLLPQAVVNSDGYRLFRATARLRTGVSIQQAREHMSSLDAQVDQALGGADHERDVAVIGVRELGVDAATRRSVWLVTVAAMLVLALASANVAAQLLSQGIHRNREIATRAALGATWLRLVRQLVVESSLVAAAGGAMGVLIASWSLPLLLAIAPPELGRSAEVRIALVECAFAAVLAGMAAVGAAVAPALRSRSLSSDGLRGAVTATVSRQPLRAQALLVMGQMVLVMPLTAAAVVLVTSLGRLQAIETGLKQPDRLLTMHLDVPAQVWRTSDMRSFQERAMDGLAALPGVEQVAISDTEAVDYLGVGRRDAGVSITLEDGRRFLNGNAEHAPLTPTRSRVTPDYFAALGLHVVAGRSLSASDRQGVASVAVVNETMVRLHWPGQDPIGRRVNFENVRAGRPLPEPWTEIVGVVADARQYRYDSSPRPAIYTPLAQAAVLPQTWTLLIRAAHPPASLIPVVRQVLAGIDPRVTAYDARTVSSVIAEATATPRYATTLVGLFCVIALLLAISGVHALGALAAAQRLREIGIRVALGANRRNVMHVVLLEGLRPAAAGIVVGVLVASASIQLISGLLFETEPWDPLLFGLAAGILVAVSVLAAYIPARRATRVAPILALRAE